MDKKPLLRRTLSKIMLGHMPAIDQIVQNYPRPNITVKGDGSPVTELDLALSSFIESQMVADFPGIQFYSEEKVSEWKFPLMALDPLDGTREYIDGRAEWAISIGLFADSKFVGEGWVYNPLTRECFSDALSVKFLPKETYRGEVSHSEWKQGLFTNKATKKYELTPMGSIAYKLGRLSAGKSDYVISLRPKNIWDIAGGTLLCHSAGLKFYSQGKEVTEVKETYLPPLIWCHEELFSELSKIYP